MKFYWNTATLTNVLIVYILHYKVKLGSCDRDCMAHKAKTIYTLALYRNSFNTSVLGCKFNTLRMHASMAGLSNFLSSHTAFPSLQHSHFFWCIWPLLIHCSCPHPALSLPHLVRRILSRDQVGDWREHPTWLVPHKASAGMDVPDTRRGIAA